MKTPQPQSNVLTDALANLDADNVDEDMGITPPAGGFTDVGLHTGGHARNTTLDCERVVRRKARTFAALGIAGGEGAAERVLERLHAIEALDAAELQRLFDFELRSDQPPIDG